MRDNFDAMALKTVLRNLIAKWGPLSTELQTAYENDETTSSLDNEKDNRKDVTPKENKAQELVDQALKSDQSENEEPQFEEVSGEEEQGSEQGELLDHWENPTDAK